MVSYGGSASANEQAGDRPEEDYATTAVRYGKMKHVGEFSYPAGVKFDCRGKVVISTDRGIELGEPMHVTCLGGDPSISREQMRAYADASGGDAYELKRGRILREATEADLAEFRRIEDSALHKLQTCREFVRQLDLNMKIVDVEQILGGERVVFYFMAEERVDFRQLVRRLAGEFQTRIEMRQVGARDEARLLADYETCGRECCCKNFLKTLKPISMAMAKLQKTTLDLSKVSGRCGRLKCCLRYEHETYESLDRKLPRLGTWIATTYGVGRIIDRQALTQLVKLQTSEGRVLSVAAEDILETNLPAPPSPAAGPSDQARPACQTQPLAQPPSPPPSENETGSVTPATPTPAGPAPAAHDQDGPPPEPPPPAEDAPESEVDGPDEGPLTRRSGRRRRGRRRRSRRSSRNDRDNRSTGSSRKT